MHTKAFLKLAAALSRGALVLTVNARLTRHIAAQYDLSMKAGGALAWPTASVKPFTSWVASFWEEHGRVPALTGMRARTLWEKVVSTDERFNGAWQASAVSKASFEALRLMREYAITLPDPIYLTEEAAALKRWSAAYAAELKRLGYIGESDVGIEVKRLIERGAPVPAEVILAGFDELSPEVSSIAGALTARGASVAMWPAPEDAPLKSQAAVVACEDPEDEVVKAARWVRALYKPGMKIGVIVPDLGRYRRSIIREFGAELTPLSALPGEQAALVFNISLGAPLIEEPLVASAIDIISVGGGRMPLSDLTRTLGSPFFAFEGDFDMARVDFKLRELNRTEACLSDIRDHLNGSLGARRLGDWLSWLSKASRSQAPSAWVRSFTELLEKIGWLGGAALSSGEYQALVAWNKALEGFSCLDDVLGKISREAAASRLSSIVKETIHQVETPDADIQVLGTLEATGLWFDHVRVIGCHEYAMPSEPSPNPFLPIGIQAAKGVAHSTGERELEFAKAVAGRLMSSAPSVIVSWPLVSDGHELRVSPLFSASPGADEALPVSSRLVDMPEAGLEDGPPDAPFPVLEGEKALLRGGTSILKNQSICPFRAFAIHRLNAKALPSIELGLRPEARGTILHEAMRLFWDDVKDSARLKELKDSGGLNAYVDGIAARALKAVPLPPSLSNRFAELERQRLSRLLLEWAEIECVRKAGFRVKTTELERTLEIGGLAVKVKADRVDELEGGGEAVLDYKTGNPTRKDWLTERPMDPQLLVYSVDGRFDAVSFARVAPGECKFLGIAREEDTLPGVKPFDSDRFRVDSGGHDWDGLMKSWKEALEGLARDFLAGVSDVDPNNLPNNDRACRYCEFGPFCRVSELGRKGDADEGDEQQD